MEEYRCMIEYMGQSEEGQLILTEDELNCLLPQDEYAVPYADIYSFEVTNYRLVVNTERGTLTASLLGDRLTPLYTELYEKYNGKVLKSLFVEGSHVLETKGEYKYSDDAGSAQGSAVIKLFDRCLCILPPDDRARRIPLCFVQSIEQGSYSHKLILDTGETYEMYRLGWDTEAFITKLNECMKTIRRHAVRAALALDPALDTLQSSRIAKLMPEGVAAPMGALSAISPSFTSAVEARIKDSRANETYLHFREICGPDEILVGAKSHLAGENQEDVLWIVASRSKGDGGVAAVEMALSEETAAATFLYRFAGGWEPFGRRLNHAMEAIDFHREVISMSDEELKNRENANYRMAVRRTASLQFLRKCFAGRIIHRTVDSWKKELDSKFGL
jgi:hypothetical protein